MAHKVINGLKVEMYDGIRDMPSHNYHQFNRFIIMATDLGDDLDAINSHKLKLARFITQGKIEEAMVELDNYHQSIVFNVENVDLHSMAFVCLCKRIGNREVFVNSDERINSYLTYLHQYRFSVDTIKGIVENIKKKFDEQLNIYFPTIGETAESITFFQKLKARTELILKQVEFGYDYSNELQKINDYLLDMYRPRVYLGSDGFEVNFMLSYDDACNVISQNTNRDAGSLCVLEFFNTLDLIKRQAKKQKNNAY